MLKVFTSNTGNNACHLVIEELNKNNTIGSNHIVIVPDRFAMSVEKEIFEYLKLDGAFNIDVVSFTRLAIKNLKGKDKLCLTKEGGIVMLTSILLDEAPNLKFYKRLVHKRELSKDLYAVIASLRASRITPETIRKTFLDKPQNLRDKYEDIAYLIEVYENRLNNIKGDSLTRLNRFEEGIINNKTIQNSHIYIIGFDSFKANEYDIINKLASTAISVNIGLNIGKSGARNSALFSIKEVKKLTRQIGGEVINQEKKMDENIEKVYSNIFALSSLKGVTSDKLVLIEEPNIYEEVKGVALEIAELIRQGYRYTDIAVVLRDNSYKSIIEDVFARLAIPLYVDKKYMLKDTLVARLVDTGINVLTSGYAREKLLAFAKNPLLGIRYEELENLNDYIISHNLNHHRLLESFATDEDDRLDETRREVAERLPKLTDTVVVKDAVAKLKKMYQDIDPAIYDRLYGDDGVSPDKIVLSINRRAEDLLDDELEEFSSLVGERTVSLEDFYTMIKGGIESVEISLIPNIIDAVFVGTNNDSRFFDKKIIFIVGALDGIMPVSSSYHAVMPERDINIFDNAEVHIYPTPMETIRKDKGALAELLTCATDRVYVSYSKFSINNTPQSAGELFKQLKYILSGNSIISLSKKYTENNAESLGSISNAYYEYLKRNSAGVDEGSRCFLTKLAAFLEEEGYKDRLYVEKAEDEVNTPIELYLNKRDGGFYVYPTQIESFYTCPFRHFMKFCLSLKDREKGDADVKVVGTFLHEVLEEFFKKTKGKIKDMTDEDIEAEARAAAREVSLREEYKYFYNDEKSYKLIKDIEKESIENILRMIPQIKVSDFVPTYFEYRFMDDGLEVKIGEQAIKLKGTIDRVDFCGDEFFIIDYKSGNVSGKDNTSKLFYGTNLQLYLYLLPFLQKGKKPVGAFYLSINAGFESTEDKVSRFVGKITLDEDALMRLDRGLQIGEKRVVSTALPSTLKVVKGVLDANQNSGFSRKDFEFSARYAEDAVKSALAAMSKGFIKKHPIKGDGARAGVCDYCEYGALCDNKRVRNIKARSIKDGAFHKDEKDG